MNQNYIYTIVLGLGFLTIFLIAEWLYQQKKMSSELTRKLVHFSSGFLILLFPVLLNSIFLVGVLCSSFMALLFISKQLHFFKGIHAVERETHGSFLYPIAVFGVYIFYMQHNPYAYFYIPIVVLAVSDPIAALFGKKWPWKPYKSRGQTKTLSGSLAFVFSSFLVCVIILQIENFPMHSSILAGCAIISVSCASAEAFVHKGYDNLTIPGTAVGALWVLSETLWK